MPVGSGYAEASAWAHARAERERAVTTRRALLAALGVAVVVATFAYLLPTIADYRDVWRTVRQLSWTWMLVLLAATVLNIATYAPPWQVALPGLGFVRALEMTQLSTALAIVLPAGLAAGMASSARLLRRWGFSRRQVARGLTLVGLWNQLLNLTFPIVALFLLTASGGETALLATAAFVGAGVLAVVVGGLVLVLASNRLAFEVGELAARVTSWALAKLRRGPVSLGGPSFERFRVEAGDLLRRRWHALTVASFVGSLTVFLVLLASLRALDVTAGQVTVVEAFAAWALIRVVASIPITPGGVGVVELGLTTALVAFGGDNAGVVAAVLVYRFLTVVPTLAIGLTAAWTTRRYRLPHS
jgi:putative heme transporter